MYIKIKSANFTQNVWYRLNIGQLYPVLGEEGDHYEVAAQSEGRFYVWKNDVEINANQSDQATSTGNAAVADEKICVQCGCRTTEIPRFDYTVGDNSENNFPYPSGGYMCVECDENIYVEAHADGELYCPAHGFIESYFNVKDENGALVGCFEGCPAAAEFDRQVKALQQQRNHQQ